MFFIILGFHKIKSSKTINVVGQFQFADGLNRIPLVVIDMLKDKFHFNCIKSRDSKPILSDISKEIEKIILNKKNLSLGDFTLFFDTPWNYFSDTLKYLPKNGIKIAYSMLESSALHEKWVENLNKNFDAVVVPDKFVANMYEESGVLLPIFILPIPLYLKSFLDQPQKKNPHEVFTFGVSGWFGFAKNHLLLLEVFLLNFKNRPNIQLKIHGRDGSTDQELNDILIKINIANVEIIKKIFTHQEYIDFLNSLDCYVLLSRGEGFSITPREAMACGLPCILSNNTAHKTICTTQLVKAVPSEIKIYMNEPDYDPRKGYQLTSSIEDSKNALLDVYNNYEFYLKKAEEARLWASQYNYTNLKPLFINLILPKKLSLGNTNIITEEGLTTNSLLLYDKYKKYLGE